MVKRDRVDKRFVMQETILKQHVRRRPFPGRPALPFRSRTAKTAARPAVLPVLPRPLPRKPFRAEIAVRAFAHKSWRPLAFCLSIAIAAISAVALRVPPIGPVDALGGPLGGPFRDRAMKAWTGLDPTSPAAGDELPLDLSEIFSTEIYVVRGGDTVSSIAAARALSIDSIIALNGVTNVKQLKAGTVLKIPNMDGVPYTVRKGDSLVRIAASWGVPMEAILDANDLKSASIAPGASLFLPGARMRGDDLKSALGELFKYPVNGRLTSTYGWRNDPFTGVRRFHAAIDLAGPMGTPIRAAMDGKVASAGYNSVYGNFVILSHNGAYQTMYAHLDSYKVEKGRRVTQGQAIGELGTTGYSTGPHLHFAVYKNGRAIDPLRLLSRR
ncbi:MAG: hypothetical protein A2Z99_12085 [Treponema sp. GWB1_62_6]|nr:MAG: hypothetical protein A2Z99_12085 [Treponema sp. GWB1_62_6]OHE67855.1 MAG: hypothetical protein A2001_20455 [Treponema sp. GWC1_61_84]OHE74159.1 MAG: hypothetical protein A2413_17800 [Treponema sp. RIFOXYC1_FULL_61_9]